MAQWRIVMQRGATFTNTVTVSNVDDIANAEWRFVFAMPNQPAFLTATTENGYVSAGNATNTKVLTVPASFTETAPLGNGRFDFELYWDDGTVMRLVSQAAMQVNPAVGEV